MNGKTQGSDRPEHPKRKNVCVVGSDRRKRKERRCRGNMHRLNQCRKNRFKLRNAKLTARQGSAFTVERQLCKCEEWVGGSENVETLD